MGRGALWFIPAGNRRSCQAVCPGAPATGEAFFPESDAGRVAVPIWQADIRGPCSGTCHWACRHQAGTAASSSALATCFAICAASGMLRT